MRTLLEGVAGDPATLYERAKSAQARGRNAHALELVDAALRMQPAPALQARLQHVRGRIGMAGDAPLVVAELLASEATAIERVDPALASEMFADAAFASLLAYEFERALVTARRSRRLARRRGKSVEAYASLALGLARVLAGDSRHGEPLVRGAIADQAGELAPARYRQAAAILLWLEEYDLARAYLERVVEFGRRAGRDVLSGALDTLAAVDYRMGRWGAAEARSMEALRLAREHGQLAQESSCLSTLARIAAVRGREDECSIRLSDAFRLTQPGELNHAYAVSAAGLLQLGLGRPDAAADELEKLVREHPIIQEPMVVPWLPDLVEAYVHVRRNDDAEAQLELLERQAEQTRRPSALAWAARCRGLLAQRGEFERLFEEALRQHAEVPTPFERARTELLFGKRLRRAHRRIDAATYLQSAMATFDQLGAQVWADQARRELAAARGRRTRAAEARPRLTPRELEVAALVQRGHTNRETAARLFVSEKAVEFHLGNVYGKLGVRSRTQLARLDLPAA